MAAIASLMHTLIVGGVATAGILIVEWGDYFSTGKAQVSWIGAIQLAVGGIGSKNLSYVNKVVLHRAYCTT